MPVVRVNGVVNPIQFPDEMPLDDIRNVLRRKFSQQAISGNAPLDLARPEAQAQASDPSLVQRIGQGVANTLQDTGIISNRFGAQEIGRNVSAIGEFLPGIGDATAGDEFGRAVATGDIAGAGLAALGAIPIIGDVAKKGGRKVVRAYHGTDDADFDSFDIDRFGTNYGTQGEPSIYTTTSKSDASFYGRDIKDINVDVTDYEEFNVMDALKETYDSFESYQDVPFDEWVEGMSHDELIEVLDFDNLIGNEARYASEIGKKGVLANFEGTNSGNVILSFNPEDIKPSTPAGAEILGGKSGTISNQSEGINNELTSQTSAQARGDSGGIRGNIGFLDEQGREVNQLSRTPEGNLAGLPTGIKGFTPRHNPRIANVAKSYVEKRGGVYAPSTQYAAINPQNSTHIADEFEAMKHNPSDPEVQDAYSEMIKEVKEQYQAALDDGLQVEFIDFAKQGDPYAKSPRMANEDIADNNHMYTFSTLDGFGSDEAVDVSDNPLLQETEFMISGKPALANDLFRVVHDYFGHAKEGVGFRAAGEENAWRAHSAMFSPKARRAMTSETRGQNSWVNYGKFGEKNRTASSGETVFADQKIGLLPEWVSEGKAKPE